MPHWKTDERGAMFVTADSQDPRFNQPYMDIREWRVSRPMPRCSPAGITTQQGSAGKTRTNQTLAQGAKSISKSSTLVEAGHFVPGWSR